MELLEKIDQKLDKIHEELVELRIETAEQGKDIKKNTKDLEDHIEGVKQKRARIEELEHIALEKKAQINLVWKLVLGVSTVVGIVAGLTKLL